MISLDMRKASLAGVLFVTSCISAPPPPPPTTLTPAPPPVYGMTVEEEARVLALEDRREFDQATASAWLANPNSLHRQRMALALGRIGPLTFEDANGNGQRDPGEKQAGVDLLARMISDPERVVRETVAFSLGEIGDPAGVEALFQLAADTDASVAAEAVEALGKIAKSVPLARYAELTRDPREGVRARALRFLGKWQSDEASAVAAANLGDPSTAIRQDAVYALSRRPYAPARERIELLLTDPNALTRAYAAAALGRIGAKESLPRLLEAIHDPHPWVRTNALVAIGRTAAKDPSALAGRDARMLIAATEDVDPGTRASSIDPLGYYAATNEGAKKRLLEIATTGSRWDRELAAGAIARQFPDLVVNQLEATLGQPQPWAIVRMLEATKEAPAGVALRRRFAAHADPIVRSNAIANIPDAGVDAEIDLVRTALADADVIVRTYAVDRYGHAKGADAATLRAFEERERTAPQNDARVAAITALGEIDDPGREAFFRSLLADRDPVVRRTAADLIEEKLKKPRPQYTPLAIDRPAAEYAEMVQWGRQPHTATIHMTRGTIDLALLTRDATMTAWNFAQLARKRFFDNTSFMRVVPNFVIQGGDPRNDMNGSPGYAIRDEINLTKYTRGAVGMALSGPDTGGSQFFITHSPQPHLDGGYTIFGLVFDGMGGVVDQTERGDKVETITIDEHPLGKSESVTKAQATPLPTEVGPTSAERLLAIVPEYAQRKADYQPDVSELEFMASSIKPEDRVEVYLGTWCPDSQREVPKFLKIVDILRDRFGKPLPVSYVAIDRSKQRPPTLIAGKSIEKVATFIYYRGDQELGRIVETPKGLLEDDLLAIVAK